MIDILGNIFRLLLLAGADIFTDIYWDECIDQNGFIFKIIDLQDIRLSLVV